MNMIYDFWDVSVRGAPVPSVLTSYEAVAWMSLKNSALKYMPGEQNSQRSQAITAMQAYLGNGGKLFISGGYLSQYLSEGSFLENYLFSSYRNPAGLYRVLGVSTDPIGYGLSIPLQSSGMEIDPISPALPVFTYDPAANNPASRSTNAEPLTADGDTITRSIHYSGTAGIRVNTGVYKLVHLAFGLDSLSIQEDRNTVMSRVMEWLIPERIAKPDILLSSVSIAWVSGFEGQRYTVSFHLKNIGSVKAPAGHKVGFKIDGILQTEKVTVPVEITPGGIWTGSFSTQVTLTDGSDEVSVCADIEGLVDEALENNNCLNETQATKANIRISPSTLTIGVNQVFAVQIWVDASLQELDSVQTFLNFDPGYLAVVNAAGEVIDIGDTNAISSGTLVLGAVVVEKLPDILTQKVNNGTGQIDLAVGVGVEGIPVKQDFLLVTVRFKALTEIWSTQLVFHTIDPLRTTRIVRNGADVTGSISSGDITIIPGVPVTLTMSLQGRAAQHPEHNVIPVTVWVHSPGSLWDKNDNDAVPNGAAYFYQSQTNSQCKLVVIIPPGQWDIRVKGKTTLENRKLNIDVFVGMGEVYMGILLEGDTNGDNCVEISDYTTVIFCFQQSVDNPNAPNKTSWCDFNGDRVVDILDYSRLLANYGKYGADIPFIP